MVITPFYFIYLGSTPEAGYLLLELSANKNGCTKFFSRIFSDRHLANKIANVGWIISSSS